MLIQRHSLVLIATLLAMPSVHAQTQTVLERLAKGGTLVIAHRESSIPFSYLDDNKKPIGYAVDLCLKIADAVQKHVISRHKAIKRVPVEFMMVTSANRIATVEAGKADMECGSTTNNAERRQKVAFTIPHFIAGARLMVSANAPISEIDQLATKKLVSTKGTTPLKEVTRISQEKGLNITIIEAPDHAKAFDMVVQGEAEAFAMDDVLLFGLISTHVHPEKFKVVGKFLSTEPLAIMLPKDDLEFKKVVDAEMRRLIQSGEIHPIYKKWFLMPIPPHNSVLNLELSYLLKTFWRYPSDYVPF